MVNTIGYAPFELSLVKRPDISVYTLVTCDP